MFTQVAQGMISFQCAFSLFFIDIEEKPHGPHSRHRKDIDAVVRHHNIAFFIFPATAVSGFSELFLPAPQSSELG